jgi:hypothetical protein
VEVRRRMVRPVHVDHDPVERGKSRHWTIVRDGPAGLPLRSSTGSLVALLDTALCDAPDERVPSEDAPDERVPSDALLGWRWPLIRIKPCQVRRSWLPLHRNPSRRR